MSQTKIKFDCFVAKRVNEGPLVFVPMELCLALQSFKKGIYMNIRAKEIQKITDQISLLASKQFPSGHSWDEWTRAYKVYKEINNFLDELFSLKLFSLYK